MAHPWRVKEGPKASKNHNLAFPEMKGDPRYHIRPVLTLPGLHSYQKSDISFVKQPPYVVILLHMSCKLLSGIEKITPMLKNLLYLSHALFHLRLKSDKSQNY